MTTATTAQTIAVFLEKEKKIMKKKDGYAVQKI
jgi:hypothetical protein